MVYLDVLHSVIIGIKILISRITFISKTDFDISDFKIEMTDFRVDNVDYLIHSLTNAVIKASPEFTYEQIHTRMKEQVEAFMWIFNDSVSPMKSGYIEYDGAHFLNYILREFDSKFNLV